MKCKIFKQKKIMSLISAFICLVVTLSNAISVKAYPSSWDNYQNLSGIYNTIYNAEKSTMDSCDNNSNYTTVYKDSETYTGDGGNTYYYAHGNSYQYTNTTIDGTNKWISRWYSGFYGPFLDYISKDQTTSAEANSIHFASDGNLYNNSDHVYISQDTQDYSDSKSLSMIGYPNSYIQAPLLINSDPTTLSESIKTEVRNNKKKNLVVLGGGAIYKTMFEIGQDFNIVRVGGAERNDTYNLLNITEQNSSGIYNPTQPSTDTNGVVCDIKTSEIDPTIKLQIKSLLDNHQFQAAADLVLGTNSIPPLEYGTPNDISSNSYQALIGCRDASDTQSKFLKVYYLKNTSGFQYGVYQYMGSQYFAPQQQPQPPQQQQPTGVNPTCTLTAPSTVVVGDDVNLSALGNTQDTSATSLQTTILLDHSPYIVGTNPIVGKVASFDATSTNKNASASGTVSFSSPGTYTARAVAVDNSGDSGEATPQQIVATNPIPVVNIVQTGTLKENRKVIIDASSSYAGSMRASINWSTAKWVVTPLNGASMDDVRIQTHTIGKTNGTVLYDPSKGINDLSSLDGLQNFDMQFKKAGQYQVQCTLSNNYGVSGSSTDSFTIVVDAKPIPNVSVPAKTLRDPSDNNNATANISAIVSSPDGDIIDDIVYLAAFNADNNHWDNKAAMDWSYQTYYVLNNSTLQWEPIGVEKDAQSLNLNNFPVGTQTTAVYKSNHVGVYDFEIIVREKPGQDYIPQFFDPSDAKIGTTWDNN